MSFKNLLNDEFSTKRLTASGNKSSYQNFLTAQLGFLQPMDDLEVDDHRSGKNYKLFCERINLIESDKVIVSGDEYVVKSLKDFNYGANPHLEAVLYKD